MFLDSSTAIAGIVGLKLAAVEALGFFQLTCGISDEGNMPHMRMT